MRSHDVRYSVPTGGCVVFNRKNLRHNFFSLLPIPVPTKALFAREK